MDAIKHACTRFCNRFSSCSQCDVYDKIRRDGPCIVRSIALLNQPVEQIISEVIKWDKDNPNDPTTYADVFFEKNPKAVRKAVNGRGYIPDLCIRSIFGESSVRRCVGICSECWFTPYPDQKKEVSNK